LADACDEFGADDQRLLSEIELDHEIMCPWGEQIAIKAYVPISRSSHARRQPSINDGVNSDSDPCMQRHRVLIAAWVAHLVPQSFLGNR